MASKPTDTVTDDTEKTTEKTDEPAEAAEEPTTDTQEESEEDAEDDEPSSSRASSSAPSTPTAAASRSPTLKAVDPPEPVKTPTPLSPRAEPFAPAPRLEDLLAQAEQGKGKEAAQADAPAGDKGKQPLASASPQKAPPVTPKPQKHANISPSKGVHSIAAKVEAAVKTGASVIPTVLQVSDMHWFTSDADLMEAAATAGVEVTFKDITFLEHKCNGKSKG